MQKYTPDYTLIREAIDSLYSATRLHANECYPAVLDRINEARTLLTQYLAQDNMVPDDDTYDGYYKAIGVEEEIARLKEQHDKEVNPEEVLNKMAHEAKGIKRLDDDLKAKVVRHGQINRQYKQRLDGVGNPDCPLYDKVVRITGTFDQIGMSRDDVAAACQRLGAKSASEGMCKSMQVVIIGNNPGPTKQAKIEQLRAEGHDITTISQFDFKEILNKYDK